MCKQLLTLSLVIALSLGIFHSCDFGPLPQREVRDAVNELVAFQDSANTIPLTVGYFECPDEQIRLLYRKLAKAGMVNYKMEVVIDDVNLWGRKIQEPHYFVSVDLTKAGQKLVVHTPVKVIDQDLYVALENKKFPEDADYASDLWRPSDSPVDSVVAPIGEENPSVRVFTPLQQAAANQKLTIVNVLTYRLEIDKIRHLLYNTPRTKKADDGTEEVVERESASAQVIFKVVNVTPFGRILSHHREGEKSAIDLVLHRPFLDRGWMITTVTPATKENDFNFMQENIPFVSYDSIEE